MSGEVRGQRCALIAMSRSLLVGWFGEFAKGNVAQKHRPWQFGGGIFAGGSLGDAGTANRDC